MPWLLELVGQATRYKVDDVNRETELFNWNIFHLTCLCFITGLFKNYLLILDIVGKGWVPNPPYLMKTQPSAPRWCFCCLVSLTKLVIAPHVMCYFLLNDMDVHVWVLGNLVVSQGPCNVSYATRRQFTED